MASDLELEFIDTDSDTIASQIKENIENEIGEELYPGDERSIFSDALAYVIIAAFNSVNDACQQKMLRYARNEVLDAIGETRGVTRTMGNTATVTVKFTMAETYPQNVIVPEGVRVTGDFEHYFITDESVTIAKGETSADVSASAEVPGSDYNGIDIGTITNIVDISQAPLVSSVTNTTVSDGGTDEEEDDEYRERIREADNRISTAGTAQSYKYWALTADSSVTDAIVMENDEKIEETLNVHGGYAFIGGECLRSDTLKAYKSDGTEAVKGTDYSFTYDNYLLSIKLLEPIESYTTLKVSYTRTLPGHVKIIPLVKGGVPSDAVIKKVYEVCSSDDVRPLTDVVDVVKPDVVTYNIDITYYTTTADQSEVVSNIEGSGGAIDKYKEWQSSEIGRDINPDELRKYVLSPGTDLKGANRIVVNSPEYIELSDLQVAQCGTVTVTHVVKDKY